MKTGRREESVPLPLCLFPQLMDNSLRAEQLPRHQPTRACLSAWYVTPSLIVLSAVKNALGGVLLGTNTFPTYLTIGTSILTLARCSLLSFLVLFLLTLPTPRSPTLQGGNKTINQLDRLSTTSRASSAAPCPPGSVHRALRKPRPAKASVRQQATPLDRHSDSTRRRPTGAGTTMEPPKTRLTHKQRPPGRLSLSISHSHSHTGSRTRPQLTHTTQSNPAMDGSGMVAGWLAILAQPASFNRNRIGVSCSGPIPSQLATTPSTPPSPSTPVLTCNPLFFSHCSIVSSAAPNIGILCFVSCLEQHVHVEPSLLRRGAVCRWPPLSTETDGRSLHARSQRHAPGLTLSEVNG